MELNSKVITYLVADFVAILWGYKGLTGNLPLESLVGLDAQTAQIVYLIGGLAGAVSLALTIAMLDEMEFGVVAALYAAADIGAALWVYVWYSGGSLPLEGIIGLSAQNAEIGYIIIGVAGVVSALVTLTIADEDTSANTADQAMG